MSPVGILFLLFLAKGAKSQPAASAAKSRASFKGKSGRTWFVFDGTAGASKTPVRSVFASATGPDHVLSFAVLPGGVRAWMFKAPSTLTATAMKDFDVQDVRANL